MVIVGCLLKYKGKILFIDRSNLIKNKLEWDIPAGKVLNGETEKSALVRIVKNETGFNLKTKNLTFIGSFNFVSHKDIAYQMETYKVNIDSAETYVKNKLNLKAKWFTKEEILSNPNTIKNLKKLIRASSPKH